MIGRRSDIAEPGAEGGEVEKSNSASIPNPLTNTEVRVIYDHGWVAAMEGKAAMACPYFESEHEEKFNAWMDGYHKAGR